MSLCLGIEIGGTKLQVATGTSQGELENIQSEIVFPVTHARDILFQLEKMIIEASKKSKITAIGVGYGGPINRATGQIICSHQVPGWDQFELIPWIQNIISVPCFVENDANTAALAEATCGSGELQDKVFYTNLGSGIGAGFVKSKNLYHGKIPSEMEFGHLKLDPSGITLESQCSGWALDKQMRIASQQSPQSHFGIAVKSFQENQNREGGEARILKDLLLNKDPAACSIWHKFISNLAFGLSHVVHLLNPDIIVIGGGISLMGSLLCEALSEKLETFCMEALKPIPQIETAQLGEDVVPIGALLLTNDC